MKNLLVICAVAAFGQEPFEFARAPTFTEGPVFDRTGNLYFSHRDGVAKVSPAGERSEWVTDPAAGFNGHKILTDGTHVVCASKRAAVWRFDASGKFLGAAASECDGKPLRAPNDIALDSQGGFYFTDPGGSREAPIGTVHYVSAKGQISLSAGELRVPNGLVVDGAGRYLNVAETVPNRILRYRIAAPGKLGATEIFSALPGRPGHDATPDGLTMDRSGNLYVAHLGTGHVLVLDGKGKIHKQLDTGLYDVSNLVLGGPAMRQLFVTGAIGHRSRTEGRVIRMDLKE